MMRTNQFADVHIHCLPDLDDGMAMLRELRDFGIREMNILALTLLEYPVDDNIRALYYKKKMTDAKVSVFGGLYYHPHLNHYGVPFLKQAETLLNMGCDGMKFIEMKPEYRKYIGFGLNSKLYDEMFDMLEERQVPIVCHINDPEEYWNEEKIRQWPIGERLIEFGWLYNNDSFLTYDEIFQEMLERLDKNPKLNIVFAHFMFLSHRIDTARKLLETYPNLKFDLTPGWEMFVGFLENYDAWRELFETYSDRILYGTDTYGYPIKKAIHETVRYAVGGDAVEIPIPHATFAHMKGFDLSRAAQENICHGNYHRLIGEPKPIRTDLLLAETQNLLTVLQNNHGDADVIARLARIKSELAEEK